MNSKIELTTTDNTTSIVDQPIKINM